MSDSSPKLLGKKDYNKAFLDLRFLLYKLSLSTWTVLRSIRFVPWFMNHRLFLLTYKGLQIAAYMMTSKSSIRNLSSDISVWIVPAADILDLWSLSFQLVYHWPDYLPKLIAFEVYSIACFNVVPKIVPKTWAWIQKYNIFLI